MNQPAAACLSATYQGLTLQWKAPAAMPIRPKMMSALSHGLGASAAAWTISSLGERGERLIAPRKPLQRPHIWHSEAPRMVLMATSGAQLTARTPALPVRRDKAQAF